jgi:hypothetical protein
MLHLFLFIYSFSSTLFFHKIIKLVVYSSISIKIKIFKTHNLSIVKIYNYRFAYKDYVINVGEKKKFDSGFVEMRCKRLKRWKWLKETFTDRKQFYFKKTAT